MRAWAIAVALMLSGCGLTLVADRWDEIDAGRALHLAGRGATLLDVSPPDSFALGHPAGALSIPLSQLWTRMDELPSRYDADILLFGDSRSRVERAAIKLREEGFFKVHVVVGGLDAWRTAGGAVSREPAPRPGFGRGAETWPGG